jgi:hypothetical protein
MEPISLILSALLSGATKGVGEAAGTAVKDAYGGLRDALKRRFAGRPPAQAQSAELAIQKYASDPEAWRPALETYLRQSGAYTDQAVIDAAAAVLAVLDPEGSRTGKYTVNLTDAQGVQVGDRNTQSNYFGSPPSASAPPIP